MPQPNQTNLEKLILIDDHEKNVNSQEVRAVTGQDFLEWPDVGLEVKK